MLRSGVAAGNTHRKLELDEFRGFALPDPLAPIVFVNAQDSIPAQIFTLAYELAHIWLNEPGVSSPDFRLDSAACENPVEQVCHSVAAKVLGLEIAFFRKASQDGKPVSNSYWKQYGAKAAKRVKTEKSAGYLSPILARNSRWFIEKLIAAIPAERAELLDAAEMLNVRGPVIDSLCYHIYGVRLRDA